MMIAFQCSEKLLQRSHPPGNTKVKKNRSLEKLLLGSHPPKVYDDDALADFAEVSTPSLSLFSTSSL